MGRLRPLFVHFRLFKQKLQFLQQINVKNVHSVYGVGIRTHDLRNILPKPGQGYRPKFNYLGFYLSIVV